MEVQPEPTRAVFVPPARCHAVHRALLLTAFVLSGCMSFEDGNLRSLLASCDLPEDIREPSHGQDDWNVAKITLSAEGRFDVQIPVPLWRQVSADDWATASGGELTTSANGTLLHVIGEGSVSFCVTRGADDGPLAERYLHATWSTEDGAAFNAGASTVHMTYTALSRYCGADDQRDLASGWSEQTHFGGGWCT